MFVSTKPRIFARIAAAVGFAAFTALALAPSPARAELAKWDQKRVATLADDIAKAIADLREEVRKQPPIDNSPQRKARYQVLNDLKMLSSTSKQLANDLRAGEGREETTPAYERMQMLRRDAAEHARSADIREPVLGKVVATQDLLRQIAPYYEEAPAPAATPAPAAKPAN